MDVKNIKQRFDIIGNSPLLDRALDIAIQVAATDLSVLITGESGVGKEIIPRVIHSNSPRKHGNYIAVNCGAIPEGTIDSELFGHEKGSFTGAIDARKGYFEVADGGTLFLDEVAELPLSTQVRLLRVLETGEFLRVGSSKPQKTDVRVVAATNVNVMHAIQTGKFREDLFYRLNTVPIIIPPLRERPEDIYLLFRKFASDFAEKYKMPVIRLNADAIRILEQYRWPGNVRQLKNVVEQLSVLEHNRNVSAQTLQRYLPQDNPLHLPVLFDEERPSGDHLSERDILYKVLFQLRSEIDELRRRIDSLNPRMGEVETRSPLQSAAMPRNFDTPLALPRMIEEHASIVIPEEPEAVDLSLDSVEKTLIKKALENHKGHRKSAAQALGISERTLYRKIKEYHLEN